MECFTCCLVKRNMAYLGQKWPKQWNSTKNVTEHRISTPIDDLHINVPELVPKGQVDFISMMVDSELSA